MNYNWNFLKKMSGIISEMASSNSPGAIKESGVYHFDEYDRDFARECLRIGKYKLSQDDPRKNQEEYKPVEYKVAMANRFTTFLRQKPTTDIVTFILPDDRKQKVHIENAREKYEDLYQKIKDLGMGHFAENGLTVIQSDIDRINKLKDDFDTDDVESIKSSIKDYLEEESKKPKADREKKYIENDLVLLDVDVDNPDSWNYIKRVINLEYDIPSVAPSAYEKSLEKDEDLIKVKGRSEMDKVKEQVRVEKRAKNIVSANKPSMKDEKWAVKIKSLLADVGKAKRALTTEQKETYKNLMDTYLPETESVRSTNGIKSVDWVKLMKRCSYKEEYWKEKIDGIISLIKESLDKNQPANFSDLQKEIFEIVYKQYEGLSGLRRVDGLSEDKWKLLDDYHQLRIDHETVFAPEIDKEGNDQTPSFSVNAKEKIGVTTGVNYDWNIGKRFITKQDLDLNKIKDQLQSAFSMSASEQTRFIENLMQKNMYRVIADKLIDWIELAKKENKISLEYYNEIMNLGQDKNERVENLTNMLDTSILNSLVSKLPDWNQTLVSKYGRKIEITDIETFSQVLFASLTKMILEGQVKPNENEDDKSIKFRLFSSKWRRNQTRRIITDLGRYILGFNTELRSERIAQTGHGSSEFGVGTIDSTDSQSNKAKILSLRKEEQPRGITAKERQEAPSDLPNYNDVIGKKTIDYLVNKIKDEEEEELQNPSKVTKTLDPVMKRAVDSLIAKYDNPQLRIMHGFPEESWNILMKSPYASGDFDDDDDEFIKKEDFRLAGLPKKQESISFNEDVLIPHWRIRNKMINEIGGATTGPGATHDTKNYQVEGDPTGAMARQLGNSDNSMLLNDERKKKTHINDERNKKTHRRRYKRY